MINDYLDPRNAEGMPKLADSTIAMEFLLMAKTGVRNCAFALTESITPEVRKALEHQLHVAVEMHEKISQLMVDKDWLHPYDLNKQFHMDTISANTAVMIAGMKLFPENSNRLGTFATPEK